MSERRHYSRLAVEGRLLCRVLDDEAVPGAPVEGLPTDICINGMGFLAPKMLQEGFILQLTLEPSLPELAPLEREAVVVGSQQTPEGCHVSCRFTSGDESDVVRMLLHLYQRANEKHTPPISQLAWMCGPEDLERWPFFTAGRDCWEVDEAPCGPHGLDDCPACPHAALAFLLWADLEAEAAQAADAGLEPDPQPAATNGEAK